MHNTIQYTKEQFTNSNNTQNVLGKCMFIHLGRFVNELVKRIPLLWDMSVSGSLHFPEQF